MRCNVVDEIQTDRPPRSGLSDFDFGYDAQKEQVVDEAGSGLGTPTPRIS
jgi:hypothetical protein